jgi:succinate dehydrogenase hydrophobic anchor subunit
MTENRLMQQVTAIFSIFMVFFYLGVGCYFVFFSDRSYLDKSVRIIMGSTFIFYGLYRAYRAYVKIVEAFFTSDKDKESDS